MFIKLLFQMNFKVLYKNVLNYIRLLIELILVSLLIWDITDTSILLRLSIPKQDVSFHLLKSSLVKVLSFW